MRDNVKWIHLSNETKAKLNAIDRDEQKVTKALYLAIAMGLVLFGVLVWSIALM